MEFKGLGKENESIEIEEGTRYSRVLEAFGINPETVIIIKDNVPIPTEEEVEEGDVQVLRVVSGG